MSVVLNVSWSILSGRTGCGGDVFLSRGSVCRGLSMPLWAECGKSLCCAPFDPMGGSSRGSLGGSSRGSRQCVRAVCPCSSSPGVSFVGPGSGGDVFLSRGRVQAVGAGKGVLHPSTPKALFLFVFLTTQKRETGWDYCISVC